MTILNWTPPQPPGKDNCPYDHCTAETPFGRFLITWKGWKQDDSPTVDETPWGDWFGAFDDIEAAQQACEDEYCKRLQAALAQSEPEGPTLAEVDDLCAEHSFLYEDDESLECLLLIITDALARWGSPAPQPVPASERAPDNRDPKCVANWPECWSGGYDPRCCRFPKSCSCERSALQPPQPQ